MSRTRAIWLILAVVLAVLAVAWVTRRPSGLEVDVAEAGVAAELRAIATASGEIVATRYADLGSSVMGKVVALPVAEGDRVRAGQLLARIDPVQAEAQAAAARAQAAALEAEARATTEQLASGRASVTAAEARAREATLAADRAHELKRLDLLPQSEIDARVAAADAAAAELRAAQADVVRLEQAGTAAGQRAAQARAQLTGARDSLAKTEVVSPMDGTVTRLNVREGEMVVVGIQNQPGTTLMTVSDLASLNVEVRVAEADVLRVAGDQPARLTLEAVPNRVFDARVTEVGASALPQTGAAAAREFRVVLRVLDPDPGLRPGLTGDVEIVTAERRNVVAVPLQAVVVRDGADGVEQRGVFVLEGDVARFTPVTTGIIGGLDIEVNGIEAGTPVIIGPFQAVRELQDGARVRRREAR
ncbi:MAG: efflux RND transporter periplasmic adaptor subunit [Acidobacteria bacterium]|nr:efflux RND transporter periplasmic adaptor subunit [Acidobacteriota bacterium]